MKPMLFTVICAFFLLLVPVVIIDAAGIEQTIQELQSKIADLQGQETTLSKEISLKNSQIALLQLKNDATKTAIAKLATEINELSTQIDQLEEIKTHRLELALHRAPESYKRHYLPLIGFLLLSQDFSDALSRMKYLSRVQQEDAKVYKQLQLTQTSYNERKDAREKKKVEQEKLKKVLEAQTKDLEQTKRAKQALLDQTKNSESIYQKLLAQALAEKQAIEAALINAVSIGPVKKGDPVALVGNTGYPGCSTGPHLHFEVRKSNAWMDPGNYLSSKTVIDEQNNSVNWTTGSGSWDWPLVDTIRLTQHFGQTPYSWVYKYSGGIHTGYDMVSTSSIVIRAPQDGTLYSSSQACGSSIIKIKYIDHGDGVMSFYLHVQ